MKSIVITGTDTDVGKTFVTSLLLKSLRSAGMKAAGYKPVCSGVQLDAQGNRSWADVEALYHACDGQYSRDILCPQTFDAPLAPPMAAVAEGKQIEDGLLLQGAEAFREHSDWLLIEGAGGWLSPITQSQSLRDFCPLWNAPVLLISRLGLGTLNHTLLTIESIERSGIPIAGIVMNQSTSAQNDPSTQSNLEELRKRTLHPVWGVVAFENNKNHLPEVLHQECLTSQQMGDRFKALPHSLWS